MAYDNDNIFAKILRGEAPAFKVYEDADSLAFMDVMPQLDGHTLVIPKYPAVDLHDCDPTILAATMINVQRVAAAVKSAFASPGIMIAQLNGSAAGQTVFHLHFHVLPRHAGVEFRMHARDMADFDLLQTHAQKIRAALDSAAAG